MHITLQQHYFVVSVSISVLGYAPSFFDQFSHNTIVVVPSPSFLKVLKLCCLVLFSCRKTQNKTKNTALRKVFYLISPPKEYFRTYFKLFQEATLHGYNILFLEIGHVTTLPMTQQMDPDRYNYCYHVFLCYFVTQIRFPFWGICRGP
jgi:hypothetical protein